MTDDLDELGRVFADVEPPDLWPEIQRRAELPSIGRTEARPRRRWLLPAGAAAAALLIAAVLIGTRGHGGNGETISAAGTDDSWVALDVPILGWHLEHPSGWHVQTFEHQCMVDESGAVITNLDRDLERADETPSASGGKFDGCSTGWQLDAVPRDFVGVEVTHRAGGPATSPDAHEPDTTRPLDIDTFQQADDLTRYQTMTIGGEPRYAVRAWLGPDASADDIAAVRRLVASIEWSNPSARLGSVDAPDAPFAELARGDGWIFGASAAGGSVCNVLQVQTDPGGSGSACGKPTEIEAVVLGSVGLKTGRMLTGTTVGRANSVIVEFRDGHTDELPALHHPDLADYSFFVTSYSPDIVGVAVRSEDGTEIARASAQALRFITEGDRPDDAGQTVPLESVNWPAVQYPFDCGTTRQGVVGWRVDNVVYAAPSSGVSLAIVVVTCNAGAGTPPTNVLVYDRATSTSSPHLLQALVRSEDNWTATDLTAERDQLTLPAHGYSSADVPRCCPDVTATLRWQWNNDTYTAVGAPSEHYR